ncbi:MAG TPA: ABC transporter ATP-binding protein [Elusimicrobiota bacterium]|jgi:putative ABC transport system ATP-binding protein|nr:ABC transporter ATP-binding protein [Elusimicrobiota bacterium]HMU95317.1 ABC transporter ATP-binding protein [Elusimicrobiota bacterium]HMX43160.1 ABC transporter ATP-binding protein [Elusimicrobiota bacterium]HND63484.1 ABC transporter ATP-binding protein [Elusimicrobiota bacterium]
MDAAVVAEPLIEVTEVSKTYLVGTEKVHALQGVTLRVNEGEFLALAGPSGSGKTTLLNLLGLVESPSAGRIRLDDTVVTDVSPRRLTRLRAERLGYVFQTFNLLPVLTVAENIEYPLFLRRVGRRDRWRRVNEMAHRVGLGSFMDHKPSQLSGGQRQRVAIARALVGSPRVVLADEPTANLDTHTGEKILTLMKELNRETKATFIFSTHDPQIMAAADRVVRLHDGRIAAT